MFRPKLSNLIGRVAAMTLLAWLPATGALAADSPDKTGALVKKGEEIVSGRCFVCHGMEGESATALFPRLAAQHAGYITKQLHDFQTGRRKSSTMQPMAAELSLDDMQAVGAYFESRAAHNSAQADKELAAVGAYIFTKGNTFSGVSACASCHGPNGHGTAVLPRLAGQQSAYIEAQLKQFNKRERTNDNLVMHSIASKLTELEIHAVAEYVSGLQ
ncbi:MAG: cytochrome c4 [Rhodocyclaceae bacterium]|nr:cytochrome c4 [Rhodocyclaceae bacterium]MBX3670222.1 cytochrome c4 [Rhodocyclaceae bacterium]